MSTARWLVATGVACAALGCAGSLRPEVLLASAHAAYPDCEEVVIDQRAEGVRQWMIVCGERRLFGLRPEHEVVEARSERGLRDGEPVLDTLTDQSPPLEWSAAQRVHDATVAATSAIAWLRPLRVEVSWIGVGVIDGTSYFSVESPQHVNCAEEPALWVDGQALNLEAAPTESHIDSRRRFVQRLDEPTLQRLATQLVEISYCGRRYALDADATRVFRQWAADRGAPPR